MIPWEKFATPQDAYDWATKATCTHLLATCPKTGDRLVLGMSITFLGFLVYKVDVRQSRHGILSTAELMRLSVGVSRA